MTQYYLDLDRFNLNLSKSEEQLGNLSDVALSTSLRNPLGSFWVDFLSKLTLYLEDGIELNKRSHFRWIYACLLFGFNLYYSIQQY